MKLKLWAIILLLTGLIQCDPMNRKLSIRVENTIVLKNIPSGSGIEISKGSLFILGDDSPVLFRLSLPGYRLLDTIPIQAYAGRRIPKKDKPDFEALCGGINKEEGWLLLFGSGGVSPQRDSLLIINPASPAEIKRYSLHAFYKEIISSNKMSREQLNIEAVVTVADKLYLLNRGKNIMIETEWDNFIKAIESGSVPLFNSYSVSLPQINGIEAGLSGAGSIPGSQTFLFTASVEVTKNWIDDGEILGSFAGIMDISRLGDSDAFVSALITGADGKPVKEKIESIAFTGKNENQISAIAVADNDDGSSTILELGLSIKEVKE